MSHEREFWDLGFSAVGGADEVGRGAWAGPVSVGIVVVPKEHRLRGVRDSKLLSVQRREALATKITQWALASAVGNASAAECDRLGMSAAQELAASRAIDRLQVAPDALLADGKWDFIGADRMVVGGDRKSLAIAAASVLAKVTRDRQMVLLAEQYPWYEFERNKGYPSPAHKGALHVYGPTPLHRTTWSWVDQLPFQLSGRQGRLFS
jgi:ribonuclease HII